MKLNPVLLCIETSNEICSVVLACGEEIISIRESDEKNSHAKNLNVFVEEIFQEAKMDIKETDAVVVSSGPGSYTGLRIGVSSAKGFCSALNAPLIAVKTLDAMLSIFDENTFRYALIHARENEFYCSAINEDNQKIYDDNIFFSSEIIFPADKNYFIAANDLTISKTKFEGREKYFVNNFQMSAKHLVKPAVKKFVNKNFEDVAYFEPNYIKPVHITKNSI